MIPNNYSEISHEHRSQIIEITGVGIFMWNLQTNEVIYSEEWAKIVGYELSELPQHVSTWESMLLPEDLCIAEERVRAYLAGEVPYYEAEFRMIKKDGTIIWGHDKGKVTKYSEDGKPLVLCGVLQDITNIKKTQEILQERTELLNLAIEVAQFGSWAWDIQNNVVSYNDEYLKMLGLKKEEILGTLEEWEDRIHPEDVGKTLEMLMGHVEGRVESYDCETRMRHKSGHYVWTKEVGRIVKRDENGKPTYMIGGHLNIDSLKHSQQKLQDALDELEVHQEKLEDQIGKRTSELVERDRLLQAVNEVSSTLISISSDQNFNEVVTNSLEIIANAYGTSEIALWRFHNVGGKQYINIDHMYLNGEKISFDTSDIIEYIENIEEERIVHIKPDGNLVVSYYMLDREYTKEVEQKEKLVYDFLDNVPKELKDVLTGYSENNYGVLLSPVYVSDKLFGHVVISSNIETVEYSDAQERMLKVIGNLFANTTKKHEMDLQLISAHEDAILSSQAKSNFLANMSHEIRTPLNAILGMAEIVLRESAGRATEEYALEIKSASESLLTIINDILDISKIESGKLEIIEIEYYITSLLNDVISLSKVRLAEKNVMFTSFIDSNIPAKLKGDEIRIKQILLNLLSNAIKFTKKGNIHFEATCEYENGNAMLKLVVQDTGIGIKQKDMDRLFMQFERVDTKKNRNIEGTGLGLAITKQLCEMMGGSISVSSEIGVGSTFTVTIPQLYEEYAPIVSIAQSKNVLLYEAREVYAKCAAKSIENLGSKCIICTNQSELYNHIREEKFDYLFAPTVHISKLKNLKETLDEHFEIVLLTDLGDTAIYRDTLNINLPVTCLQLSGVLGRNDSIFQSIKDEKLFIAPNARVLVVDDNIVNLKVAKGLMAPYKFSIDTAINGMQAVQMVQNSAYDLVFMDHMMPEMDGIDATVAIRKLQGDYYKKLPIIALTANALVGARELFVKEGMNDFLAKPIEMQKLNHILRKWIPQEKLFHVDRHEGVVGESECEFYIEGVDASRGIKLMGGDMEDYLDVLRSFYSDGLIKLKTIKQSQESSNIGDYRIEIHAVKSASASIGAHDLSELARNLENAAIKEDLQYIAACTDEFLHSFEQVLGAIKEKLVSSEGNSEQKELGDVTLLINNMDLLGEALDLLDIDIIEQTLEKCMLYEWSGEIGQLLKDIRECTESFEYYNARPILAKINDEIGEHYEI